MSPLRDRLTANPYARGALFVLAAAALAFTAWRWQADSGISSASVFPRMNQRDFVRCLRNKPFQALSSLLGQCGGDWRRLPEPARHVFASALSEMQGDQPGNPAAPTAEEVSAAYAAMRTVAPDRSGKGAVGDRQRLAEAREAYILAHPEAFAFAP